jgi:hypothetical protein
MQFTRANACSGTARLAVALAVATSASLAAQAEVPVRADPVATDASEPSTPVAIESAQARRTAILSRLPTNSDKRCVGITVVAAALLEGVLLPGDECDQAAEIAGRIYRGLTTGQPLRHHRYVCVAGKPAPLTSAAAMDALSTRVAEHYKRDYDRLSGTPSGRRQLVAAQNRFVATSEKLRGLLEADTDHTEVFIGIGDRTFPDGTVQETYHAFLVGLNPQGQCIIYDSNDPGKPIPCELSETSEGVELAWTCRYRDTNQQTTQRYLVIAKREFFRAMHGG